VKPAATAPVKLVPLAELKAHPRNPRRHDRGEIDALKASILEYGFTEPLIRQQSSGHVVAGAGRLQAASELAEEGKLRAVEFTPGVKLNGRLPVVDKHLTDRQALAYCIADNRITERGTWDMAEVKDILVTDLGLTADVGSFDLPVGFDPPELQSLEAWTGKGDPLKVRVGKPGLTDDDAVPDAAPSRTKPGDVWLCGKHRVMCGDSTKAEDVARLMGGIRAALCFTSPPYNAGDNSLGGNKNRKNSKYVGGGDDRPAIEYLRLLVEFTRLALLRCSTVAVNLQSLAGNKVTVLEWAHQFRSHFVDRAVWFKGQGRPAMAANVLNSRFEDVWILTAEENPSRAIPTGAFHSTVSNVYEGRGASGENVAPEIHAAAMPVHCALHFVASLDGTAGITYDPFVGTGTTLIACEKLDRVCYGMEIEPRYVDVAVKRWQDFTGRKAVKERAKP